MGIFGENSIDFILTLVKEGAEREFVRVNTKDYSFRLEVSQQTISRWVCGLEKQGYIEREKPSRWPKISKIRFTAEAKEALNDIRKVLGSGLKCQAQQ